MPARSASCLLAMLAACSGSGAPGRQPEKRRPTSTQLAVYHLHADHVQLSVDGRIVFDRDVSVVRDNARPGLAAVAHIDLPACANIVVKTKHARKARRICLTPQTRSIVIDGGPPLTIAASDRFQGED